VAEVLGTLDPEDSACRC